MNTNVTLAARTAVLDEAHILHIHGALHHPSRGPWSP